MDSRITVRLTDDEKQNLITVCNLLELNLSEYVRLRLTGSTEDVYMNFVKNEIKKLEPGQEITFKKLIFTLWEHIGKIERKGLLSNILKEIEKGNLNLKLSSEISKTKDAIFTKLNDIQLIEDIANSLNVKSDIIDIY
jgi:hypothetical protein